VISIVIPIHNEEESIALLYTQILKAFKRMQEKNFEIIFVDDGSSDTSSLEILELKARDKKIKPILFRKHYGKGVALSAGFSKARGDTIITMDADLQESPFEIPLLLEALNPGFDLVVGWRINRRDGLCKKAVSKVFNALASTLSDLRLHDMNCGAKAMRRCTTKAFSPYKGFYRYFPVFVHHQGYKVGEVKIGHCKRRFGKSKYGFLRIFSGMVDFVRVKTVLGYMESKRGNQDECN